MNNFLKKACMLTASIFTINANAETKIFTDLEFAMQKKDNIKGNAFGAKLGYAYDVDENFFVGAGGSVYFGGLKDSSSQYDVVTGNPKIETFTNISTKSKQGSNAFFFAGFNPMKEVSLYAKLGYGFQNAKSEFSKESKITSTNNVNGNVIINGQPVVLTTSNVSTKKMSDSSTVKLEGMLYGFGTSFNINKDYSIFAEYTILDYKSNKTKNKVKINLISAGFRIFF